MADTEELAPSRSANSGTTRRAASAGGTPARRSRARSDNLEAQVERLQSDLKSIGATLAKMTEEKVSEASGAAKSEVKNLVKQGQNAVDDIQDEFGHMEKQIKDSIRQKPLTAVAGAVALGFVLALITR